MEKYSPEIIGNAASLKKLKDDAQKFAKSNCHICLIGESGTGKEVFARFIHSISDRSDRPFVPMNCGAVSKDLIISELFGYEKGAFTGAIKEHKGVFEQANNGTVFLDEIGELSSDLQVQFLRVLQDKRIKRVGGERDISLDFRLICATNKDLKGAVENSEFRTDLFYRISGATLPIPSLRNRKDDIPILAEYFYRKTNCRDPQSNIWEILKEYDWPGNVRELEMFVGKIAILYNQLNSEVVSSELVQHKTNMPRLLVGKQRPSSSNSVSKYEPFLHNLSLSYDTYGSAVCGIAEYVSQKDRASFLGSHHSISADAGFVPLLADAIALVCLATAEDEKISPLQIAKRDFALNRMGQKSTKDLWAVERTVYIRLKNF